MIIDNLIEPKNYSYPIDCSNFEYNQLLLIFKKLLLIRSVEEKLAYHKKIGEIIGPVHLGAGQEAIAVGISENLRKTDRIFGAHRSHAHLLSLGSDVRMLFAEILGRATGHSKGMGGSMHLRDSKNGFMGSVPIVSGTISLAVGSALASMMQNKKDVAVSYFGDGAVEEGVFHESLNLAKILKCPVLFVCENNLFSSHMHISKRQPFVSTARFALANDLPYKIVDGNNIIDCLETSKELIEYSRENNEPTFLEAITFRKFGHVDWREDIDVGINRSKRDLDLWKKRDPIKRMLEGLFNGNIIDQNQYDLISEDINRYVNECWIKAKNDPYPDIENAYEYVYSRDKKNK